MCSRLGAVENPVGLTPLDASTLSRAAQLNVDRAVEAQQRRNAGPVLWVRVGLTALGCVLFLSMQNADPTIEISRKGTYVYFALAVLIFGVVRAVPRLLIPSLSAVAFVDVPLLGYLQYAQLPALAEPLMNTPTNAAMMTGLVAFSALALSRKVIALTAVTATISVTIVTTGAGLAPLPVALVLVMVLGVAICSALLVQRIREVVKESRQRDLLGKYILGDRLGAGGMAEVFEATYCPEGGFERRVAVKKILPAFLENAEAVGLFRREARLGAGLSHPNLVNVLDFGSTEAGGYFLVMEFVDGCPLGDVLRWARAENRPLTPVVVASIAWSLADALDYLHEHVSPAGTPQRLVHRDVNPPNVLLSRNADVKLSDFGIARDVDGDKLTQDGLLRGKLPYTAPEQYAGAEPDRRLDLFALGVTLYECLGLRRPYQGTDAFQLQRAITEGHREPLPPEVVAAAGPLVPIIEGLLHSDPDLRTQHAREVTRQLSALPPAAFDAREGRRQLAFLITQTLAARSGTRPVISAHDLATQEISRPMA